MAYIEAFLQLGQCLFYSYLSEIEAESALPQTVKTKSITPLSADLEPDDNAILLPTDLHLPLYEEMNKVFPNVSSFGENRCKIVIDRDYWSTPTVVEVERVEVDTDKDRRMIFRVGVSYQYGDDQYKYVIPRANVITYDRASYDKVSFWIVNDNQATRVTVCNDGYVQLT
ncbi:TPA: hypothetical protein DIV55_01470 [Patescibacteria group bacterium]|uniref:Uncharacterized protein n=1 Tax=Candidatus Gottesmanbacteria bacterium GW2011_GWA1_43_11 TaxID=1618436 RepID=A0A0G1CGV4_9BACT|nr:MAG: hypothetical protein UV59_C0015G0012 [Candidatus Gottesmanbacteria bacterium GW2011_GWA1_43_11]HCS78392.1 hypothetical protein [Patescibacteria group bacterium]